MDKLWKELQASPENAFKELLKTLERESHEEELQKLEKYATAQIGIWTRIRKDTKEKLIEPTQEKFGDWIEKFGIFRHYASRDVRDMTFKGKAHFWNPLDPRPSSFFVCGAKPRGRYKLSYKESLYSSWPVCSKCASSSIVLDKECTPHPHALRMLWGGFIGAPGKDNLFLHLKKADGSYLCNDKGDGGQDGVFCTECLNNMGGIEDFKREVRGFHANLKKAGAV